MTDSADTVWALCVKKRQDNEPMYPEVWESFVINKWPAKLLSRFLCVVRQQNPISHLDPSSVTDTHGSDGWALRSYGQRARNAATRSLCLLVLHLFSLFRIINTHLNFIYAYNKNLIRQFLFCSIAHRDFSFHSVASKLSRDTLRCVFKYMRWATTVLSNLLVSRRSILG